MKICLVATHSFPISPVAGGVPHTGDVVILDLAHGLTKLGHDVSVCAPEGTNWPQLLPMKASYGKYPPSSDECEWEAFCDHRAALEACDIVHDFSNTKRIVRALNETGFDKTISTLMGGPWRQKRAPHNLCVWSEAHRGRVLRGATDYEGTPTPDAGGTPGTPVKEAHVVWGGVDTDFYCPGDSFRSTRYLWLNRWHPAKGCKQAIDMCTRLRLPLEIAGEKPKDLLFDSERAYAKEMIRYAASRDVPFVGLEREGHHEHKREMYRHARALLYPVQFHEPFGLSMVEAQACGTPVVGCPLGSVPEVVDNRYGFSCMHLEDVSVLDIPPSPTHPLHQYAVDNFSREAFARRYLAEYERVLGGDSW